MWSDTLLAAERGHLLRLVLWAATSATLGMALVAIIVLRRRAAPIVLGFAVQTLAWGTIELIVTSARWYALGMRDVSGAARLDRLTWLAVGLDVGLVAVGVTAAVVASLRSKRIAVIGSGLGIIVQGLGLLVLDLTFASILGRLV